MSVVSTTAGPHTRPGPRPGWPAQPHRAALRLVHGQPHDEQPREQEHSSVSLPREQEHSRDTDRPSADTDRESPCVLIAAAGQRRRATVRHELAEALAPGTPFSEAGSIWEVLQKAPTSGVVMLAGDLEDVPAGRLMHVLGQRHPRLPIVVLESPEVAGNPTGIAGSPRGVEGSPTRVAGSPRGSRED
jgi:hypothetical protein